MAEVELKLCPALTELAQIDSALEDIGDEFRLSEELAHAIRLCAHEIFTNIVTHGFDGEQFPASPVDLKISADDSSVKMQFLDRGRAYNPVYHSDPDLPNSVEDAQVGGLGVMLVKAFSSGIAYSREDSTNRLEIVFDR